eukprot:2887486-Pyramimonas_sp.AAC.1
MPGPLSRDGCRLKAGGCLFVCGRSPPPLIGGWRGDPAHLAGGAPDGGGAGAAAAGHLGRRDAHRAA